MSIDLILMILPHLAFLIAVIVLYFKYKGIPLLIMLLATVLTEVVNWLPFFIELPPLATFDANGEFIAVNEPQDIHTLLAKISSIGMVVSSMSFLIFAIQFKVMQTDNKI